MADVAKTVAIIFEGKDDTSPALSAVERGLQDVGKAGEQVRTAGDEMDRLGNLSAAAGGLLKGAFAAFTIAEVVRAFIDANVQVEQFSRAMGQIKGSTELAAQEFDYLKKISNTLGLEVRSAADAYVSLSAATKGTALEGQQTRVVFEAVANAMSLLGKSSADTQGALLAVQQIVSKGTVSAEELRGQLGERLPGAFQIAAKSIGVTTEELGKLLEAGKLTAQDFLPKFAAELERTFGNVAPVDTYTAAMNRLKNQLDETLVVVGKAGAFDALSAGLGGAGELVGGLSVLFQVLIRDFDATRNLLRGGSFDVFNEELKISQDRLAAYTESISGPDGLNQSLAETARLNRQNADAAAGNGDQTEAETARLIRQANAQATALKEVGDAYKTLGLNPDKLKAEIAEILSAFETLADSPAVKGDQLLQGLEAALKRVTDDDALGRLELALQGAFDSGKISADEFARALDMVSKREEALDKAAGVTTQSVAKQAAETRKAEEATAKMALELEKLASNERIKKIEAFVTLNVAQVEAETKRIEAAFDSINTTIESTGDLIGKAFGLLADPDLDFYLRSVLKDQIDIENDRRDAALQLQKRLTDAQIDLMRAQVDKMQRGDAMIKVDGAGLKPHLEAFMWEILKAIQVKANEDGLDMLLGT